MTRARTRATAALALWLAGCGYFNTMYNAQRRFRDAQAARIRGDDAAARQAYAEAIEKAARSYRSHPDGRWADDALFLIGRAHFSLGDYAAARAAIAHLLSRPTNPRLRADAFAIRGAAELQLGEPETAAASLDSAASIGTSAPLTGFLHLWRARTAFTLRDSAQGWRALAQAHGDPATGRESRIEAATRALELSDSSRLRNAFDAWLGYDRGDASVDSLLALARAATERFGAAYGAALLEPAQRSGGSLRVRNMLALERARQAGRAGELESALAESERIATTASSPIAEEARTLNARLRLGTLDDPAGLAALRSTLLPSAGHPPLRELLHAIHTVEVLRERSEDPLQRIALFAAAEVARDSLAAPALARRLFLDYAESAAGEPWIGKALLAALQLSEDGPRADSIRKRMARHPDDVYVRAVSGTTDEAAFALAEERLARSLIAVRHDASALAEQALLSELDTLSRAAARVRRDSASSAPRSEPTP